MPIDMKPEIPFIAAEITILRNTLSVVPTKNGEAIAPIAKHIMASQPIGDIFSLLSLKSTYFLPFKRKRREEISIKVVYGAHYHIRPCFFVRYLHRRNCLKMI